MFISRLDALSKLHKDAKWEPCGKGYAPPGTCKAGKPSGQSVTSRHILMPHTEPYSASGQQEKQGRSQRLNLLLEKLEKGKLKELPTDSTQTKLGKGTTLEALRDAKNPRIGLITAHAPDGSLTGATSYKEGKHVIELQHIGSDGSQKGSGNGMFQQLLHYAAAKGKGIETSSIDDAKGFYTKMGMTDQGYGQFSMSKQAVAAAVAKISSRKDSTRTDATATEMEIYKEVGKDLQDASGSGVRLRQARIIGSSRVEGVFTSTADGKAYSFTWNAGRVTYQPLVAKTDSMSDAEHSIAWLRASIKLENASGSTRIDSLALHLDTTRKCGTGSYFCKAGGSGTCLPVHKSCSNNGTVNKERLTKVNALIEHLQAGGAHPSKALDKPDVARLQGIQAHVQGQRDLRAQNLQAGRAGDRMAQAQPKEEPGESLGQLFTEADRVGSKYQTAAEVQAHQQKMAQALGEVGDLIDKHFPDEGGGSTDYGQSKAPKITGKAPGKGYLPSTVAKFFQPKSATMTVGATVPATKPPQLIPQAAEEARRSVMGIDKVPVTPKTARQATIAANLPTSGTVHTRQSEGGTFVHPTTGATMYKHKSPTDAELKDLSADGGLDLYRRQAAKFGIQHNGSDRDLVARVEAWRSKTQAPDISARRNGASSTDVLKQAATEINALPAHAFASPVVGTVGGRAIAPAPVSGESGGGRTGARLARDRGNRPLKARDTANGLELENHEGKKIQFSHAEARAVAEGIAHSEKYKVNNSIDYGPNDKSSGWQAKVLVADQDTEIPVVDLINYNDEGFSTQLSVKAAKHLLKKYLPNSKKDITTAPQAPKDRSRTAGDDPNYRGKYRHVSIDSMETAEVAGAIARLQKRGLRIDAATAVELLRRSEDGCGCDACKTKKKKRKQKALAMITA